MAFPASPTVNQQHTEGGVTRQWTGSSWRLVTAAPPSTNIVVTEAAGNVSLQVGTGTADTIAPVTTTLAGVMIPADKTKLDGIETGATADQSAAEVPVTAAGNLVSTNVQAALEELQGDINNLTALGAGDMLSGTANPIAANGADGQFWFNVTSGDIFGPKAAGAWPATAASNAYTQLGLAGATLVSTAAGAAGTAVTAARSDHRHIESTGAAFPATDGTAGIRHILVGHATEPDGDYILVSGAWLQVG